jgi:hypothetical protein
VCHTISQSASPYRSAMKPTPTRGRIMVGGGHKYVSRLPEDPGSGGSSAQSLQHQSGNRLLSATLPTYRALEAAVAAWIPGVPNTLNKDVPFLAAVGRAEAGGMAGMASYCQP